MDERIDGQEIGLRRRRARQTRTVRPRGHPTEEHPIEREHLIVREYQIVPGHRTEREHPIEPVHPIGPVVGLLCRTDNLRQHQTDHQTFLQGQTGRVHHLEEVHHMAAAVVQWAGEVVHLEVGAEEGDNK